MESMEHLPEEEVPPTQGDLFGGGEAKGMAFARVRSSQGPGAHAFVRTAPTDRERVIPTNELSTP